MRCSSDSMEDAASEDTMMECGGGDVEDLVYSTPAYSDSAPNVRDTAERLLTLLGTEDDVDDCPYSEDEGVELDEDDSADDDEPGGPRDAQLLRRLVASLAEELKYANKIHGQRHSTVQSMEVIQEPMTTTLVEHYDPRASCQDSPVPPDFSRCKPKHLDFEQRRHHGYVDACLEMDAEATTAEEEEEEAESTSSSWSAGWDACASEALRYLVEDEGLPSHHPTVIAMRNHLELQRERNVARYAI